MALASEATLDPADESARPTRLLPLRQLVDLSIYWLGLSCIWAGLDVILAGRLEYEGLVPAGTEGGALVRIGILGAFVAAFLQPTVGAVSDYTTSRWGRRKPYIFVGSLLDVLFLVGIATSNSVLMLAVFFLLLQASSNSAQGPFQGYVPDLVAEPQVGLASALLGIFSVLGIVTGTLVGSIGVFLHQYGLATVGLGLIEVATMLVVFYRVHEGRAAKDRRGMSWLRVAGSAWGLDILKQRSFMWLLGSRFFFLMAGGVLMKLALFYVSRSLGQSQEQTATLVAVIPVVVIAATALAIVPSARISDLVGRKPVIWVACAVGAAGMLVVMLAPGIPVAFAGTAMYGIAAGIFLAVDWALMTDIIPKASSGRYMGLSNVATATSGIAGLAIGATLMDVVGGPGQDGSGPRAAMGFAALAFVVAAALLVPVREPARGRAARRAAEAVALAGIAGDLPGSAAADPPGPDSAG
jgi:Na+/melibiose symporter-like transporter